MGYKGRCRALSYCFLPTHRCQRASSRQLWTFRRIEHLIPLHDPDLRVLFRALDFALGVLRPLRYTLIVTARVDA
jgi:hypothetical protein